MDNNVKYYRHLVSYRISGEERHFTEWHFSKENGHEVLNDLNEAEIRKANSKENEALVGTPEGYKTKWWNLLLTHEISYEDYMSGTVFTIPLNQYIYYVNPA